MYKEEIVEDTNKNLSDARKIRMPFSNEWYTSFHPCHKLRKKWLHAGGDSANLVVIDGVLPKLVALVDK